RQAHRRVVDQRVGGGACLLVLDHARGEVHGAERRVQNFPCAQKAERPAAGDLPARIGRRQFARPRRRLGLDRDRLECDGAGGHRVPGSSCIVGATRCRAGCGLSEGRSNERNTACEKGESKADGKAGRAPIEKRLIWLGANIPAMVAALCARSAVSISQWIPPRATAFASRGNARRSDNESHYHDHVSGNTPEIDPSGGTAASSAGPPDRVSPASFFPAEDAEPDWCSAFTGFSRDAVTMPWTSIC